MINYSGILYTSVGYVIFYSSFISITLSLMRGESRHREGHDIYFSGILYTYVRAISTFLSLLPILAEGGKREV